METVVEKPVDAQHAWVGLEDGAGLERWVRWHLREHRRHVAELEGVAGERTVRNTVEVYDRAVMHLMTAGNQTYLLFATHAEAGVRDAAQGLLQEISAEQTRLGLNQRVYEALEAVKAGEGREAEAATRHLLERTTLQYRLAGVNRDEATRERIRGLQERMTEVSLRFSRNVQDDVRTVRTTREEMEGLPADYIARHQPDAEGVVTLSTDPPDYMPVMSYARSRRLRREMYLQYMNRAFPVNAGVLRELLEARQEMAEVLGFGHWADLAMADQMMGSAVNLQRFLGELDEASRGRAEREFGLLRAFVEEQDADAAADLTQTDAGYWNEQFRRARYDFDAQSVRPFLPYAEVEAGVLRTVERLFHLQFERAVGAAVWDPSVRAYDVFDGGQRVGRVYLDMHPREGKNKWFSETQVLPGKVGVQVPEAALICNFPGSANFPGGGAGEPGLMEFADVVTFFHEFGHLMHEILGGRQHWGVQAGVSTEGDFVEVPSQLLEEFVQDVGVLQGFARHYQTGEVLGAEVIERMHRAGAFGRGAMLQRQLMFATYSLQVHNAAPAEVDFDRLWAEDAARFSPYRQVEGAHMYASFTHLTGYSSNYYTYLFDKVIALDFFGAFATEKLLEGPAAMRYRRAVLEKGGSTPGEAMVREFLGREQTMEAMERWMDREFEETAATAAV